MTPNKAQQYVLNNIDNFLQSSTDNCLRILIYGTGEGKTTTSLLATEKFNLKRYNIPLLRSNQLKDYLNHQLQDYQYIIEDKIENMTGNSIFVIDGDEVGLDNEEFLHQLYKATSNQHKHKIVVLLITRTLKNIECKYFLQHGFYLGYKF